MKDGFIKVAAVTPKLRVADIKFNTEAIFKAIEEVQEKKAKIVVFPELCITGCTCGDLFFQEVLLKGAKSALKKIAEFTMDKDMLVFVGLPLAVGGKIYNAAAALNRGDILGFVTKRFFTGPDGAYGTRQFARGPKSAGTIMYDGKEVPFGPGIIFRDAAVEELVVSAEIGEDLYVPVPPSVKAAAGGAVIIANCAAFPETVGEEAYCRDQVKAYSSRIAAGYVLAGAGEGESTTDMVFAGKSFIVENGEILKESTSFENKIIYSEIDIHGIMHERQRNVNFPDKDDDETVTAIFYVETEKTRLSRQFPMLPFVPSDLNERKKCCEEILKIQSYGLKKRLEHTHVKKAVLGISGGLDSTLALLVTARAFDLSGLGREGIIAVTMPCFGTTDRTYQNACKITRLLGASLREINIAEAVKIHFSDIGHDPENFNAAYENAQARERTQVLMDLANDAGGLVIGTGDLSELALGWATYNGDHMSMYAVNASVPKTLVRYLVRYEADRALDHALAEILYDVLDTPVSPELLPPKDDVISQRTEDIVGPYELHDFFLYDMLRKGFPPSKIFRLAQEAFAGKYDNVTILKWLEIFTRRFFGQQFKRSCLPDGPKVGTVGISPRSDLKMASDSCYELWLQDLANIILR